ncbi:hypothetical protein EJ05DRAFT_201641 [Pseudovirgaria hyperparasitica]|uniref:Bicarbonate transporter-like transmembrane domain-containing protein n=1 Tax=Pseudovirgaria hyperparasitica TaxID=470096 RepID=A0A6A6WHE1_9PEZI|nr:uncharacterized protein EJ05DRAFT_201641 [Pseudovirgaria hyperparasitica]KAF2762223.1 hypothetical protein EJ05DRAFT_201641 [Pseudovirgaria hyperparasitica]
MEHSSSGTIELKKSDGTEERSHRSPPAHYTFDGVRGWRRYRWLRPGWGMYHDVKRRLPYYWTDITDAWSYRAVAATIRMYFVNLLPALAYLLDMQRRTGGFYGVNEALFASALAAVVFSILGAQPITIVGITGLISLFNYTTYDIISLHDVRIYPQFMAWMGIWAAIFHWIAAFFNTCDYMRYVTDFSSESFGLYVGIIYVIKGVEELANEFSVNSYESGYLGCIIAILYFGTVFGIEKFGVGLFMNPSVRRFVGDYSYVFGSIFWTGFAHFPGRVNATHVSYVPITKAFYPSIPRAWIIDFWTLDVKWVFVAMPFGFLLMLLFYYDHNVSSITAQARHYPLLKPGGFHWDFFLLGCTTLVSAILGLPMPNGLVPQAPVHTDSLTYYTTNVRALRPITGALSRIPTTKRNERDGQSDERDPAANNNTTADVYADADAETIYEPIVRATHVLEQRITHLAMGILLIITMTHPLLVVLHTMPTALFGGVFIHVGLSSLLSNGIVLKWKYLLTERRMVSANDPLKKVGNRKVLLWTAIQFGVVAACVAISQTIAAIGFPVLIIALIPLRTAWVPRWFSRKELAVLDALTANSEVVLASLGGAPPDFASGQGEE